MLEVWGLRVSGGSLKSPLRKSTGGILGPDDELSVAHYVEAVEWFDAARPLLIWRYVDFEPVQTFKWRQPGETRMTSLIRLEWAQFFHLPSVEIPMAAHDFFLENVERQMKVAPWYRPVRIEAPDAMEIGENASEGLYQDLVKLGIVAERKARTGKRGGRKAV